MSDGKAVLHKVTCAKLDISASQELYVPPTRCIYVFLCGSENKQRLFTYTALTGLFL